MALLRPVVVGIALAVTSLAAAAAAQSGEDVGRRRDRVRVGVHGEWLDASDHEIGISRQVLRTRPGVGVGTSIDWQFWEFLEAGIHTWELHRGGRSNVASSSLAHVGAHFGVALTLHERIVVGVAALAGYQVVDFHDAETDSTGLGLGGVLTARVSPLRGFWLQARTGFLTQPTGGHSGTDLTFSPTLFVGTGFAITLVN